MPEDETREATLEAVLAAENLRAACWWSKPRTARPGWTGWTWGKGALHLRGHWEGLRAKLLSGDYVPGAVRAVAIPSPAGARAGPAYPTSRID